MHTVNGQRSTENILLFMEGKLIIISAPSGCGKSTIISHIINDEALRLSFSVSAATRAPREGEVDGVNYYFMSQDEFKVKIERGEFAEYEQVYAGNYYGTLKSEIARIQAMGRNVVLDLDVNGGVAVKGIYGDDALSIFIMPPSLEVLRERLEKRGTDGPEEIDRRVARAAIEVGRAGEYDAQVVNDDLDTAVEQTRSLISGFVNR